VDGRRPDVVFEDAHSAGVGLELELAAVRVQIEAFRSVVGTSSGLYLAVNSSPTTLESPHLLELVGPSAGEQRVIEITEHTDASADMLVRAVLAANQRSIRVAIDDAGAGFSGLKRIVEMSPDVLKLDRSLVTHLDTDRSKRALVAAMAGFAREIGSVIVAEGIETEAELKSLQSLGVDLGQGFLLGRPAPLTRGAV
jgi:EAL domain-containing protein (putative c-di-GMP-specific phosphodiesterase class I)